MDLLNVIKEGMYMAQDISKSWFAVLNNPADHGYSGTPQEVCERLRNEWIRDSTTRSGAWAYCVSAEGLHHIHFVLEDLTAMRFTGIKKSYAQGMHFQATKGSKQQAEDYIYKRHPYDEKGEKVLYICKHGVIRAASGQRSDLALIENLLADGKNPQEIMDLSLSYRKYEKMIKDSYFRIRAKEVPTVRTVTVHYIYGESGSGKSFTYAKLCEEFGEANICFVTDYANGGFDHYAGERILFLDEYKGQFIYSTFLTILDKYKAQIHARYTNALSLWNEVYITSVFAPEELHKCMVSGSYSKVDSEQQLFRRISDITYCYKDDIGGFHRYTIPMNQYMGADKLKKAALLPNQFEILSDDNNNSPFN